MTINRSPTRYLAVCPRNQVRSWSHASWVMNCEKLAKKLLAVCPKTATRRKKGRETRVAIGKLLTLNANAKN